MVVVAGGTIAIRHRRHAAAPRRAADRPATRRGDATRRRAGSSARRSPTSAAGSSSTTRCSASAGRAPSEAEHYEPYLADARARFPDLPERALPSPEHAWGVQNAYVQAAADLGVGGLAAWLALFLVPLAVAWRAGPAAGVPILWLLVSMGIWIGLGLVAGIPLVGLTWLVDRARGGLGSLA